jgi:large subunit ribosomal protein L17
MRHHNTVRKFGREKNQRHALMRSLAYSLLVHEKMVTTLAKAKELRPYMEKLVTRGKTNSLASRRIIFSRIGRSNASKKLIDTISPKYQDRNGGYTRITKMGKRNEDGAEMAVIEFV